MRAGDGKLVSVLLGKIGESALADTSEIGSVFGDLFDLNFVSRQDPVHAYVCGDSFPGRDNFILLRVEMNLTFEALFFKSIIKYLGPIQILAIGEARVSPGVIIVGSD